MLCQAGSELHGRTGEKFEKYPECLPLLGNGVFETHKDSKSQLSQYRQQ